MCERRKDEAGSKEPLAVYWVRCLAEMLYQRPASFVAICCCVALYYTYRDLQTANERAIEIQQQFLERQTSAMVQITEQLGNMNVMLRRLEQHHGTHQESQATSP